MRNAETRNAETREGPRMVPGGFNAEHEETADEVEARKEERQAGRERKRTEKEERDQAAGADQQAVVSTEEAE